MTPPTCHRYVRAEVLLEDHAEFSKNFEQYVANIPYVLLYYNGMGPVKIGQKAGPNSTFEVAQDPLYQDFLAKAFINPKADNIFELYNATIMPDRVKQILDGGCVSSTSSYDTYSRVLITLSEADDKDNIGELFVCVPANETDEVKENDAIPPTTMPASISNQRRRNEVVVADADSMRKVDDDGTMETICRAMEDRAAWEYLVSNPTEDPVLLQQQQQQRSFSSNT